MGALPFTRSFPDLLRRFGLQETLRLNFMNRERRERREHGPLLPSLLSVLSLERMGEPSPWTLPRTALNLQRTLPFLFAVFAPFAVKNTADTPFFVRGFRAFRG